MTHAFLVHEFAETEINEAADFYDLESPGLGSAFIDEIQGESCQGFPFVARRPTSHQ